MAMDTPRETQGSQGLRPHKVTQFKPGRVDDDVDRTLIEARRNVGHLAGRLFNFTHGGLHILNIIARMIAQTGDSPGQLARGFGQLREYRLHLSTQRVGAYYECADNSCHHDAGGQYSRDPDALQSGHEGAQGVG